VGQLRFGLTFALVRRIDDNLQQVPRVVAVQSARLEGPIFRATGIRNEIEQEPL
jgi:hypothetical protein